MDAISAFLTYYQKSERYSKQEKEMIAYSYLSIRNDVSKLMIMLLAAALFRKCMIFCTYVIPMILVRCMLGGLHKDTYWKCFFSSLIWILVGIAMAYVTSAVGGWFILLLEMIISISITAIIGPLPSEKRKREFRRDGEKKKRVLALEAVIFLFAITRGQEIIKHCIFMGVLIDNIQLLMLLFEDRRR